jgi:hypothetical protein
MGRWFSYLGLMRLLDALEGLVLGDWDGVLADVMEPGVCLLVPRFLDCGVDEPESLILAQSERWRHA